MTCTTESQQEEDLWGKAVVFWHMERKRDRARGKDGGGEMKMPALLLGLWCLILSYSTGESAAQIKLLKAHVHTLFKSLPHIFSTHDTLRQTFLLKGIKLLCGAAGGMHHSVFHLIWWNISQDVISSKGVLQEAQIKFGWFLKKYRGHDPPYWKYITYTLFEVIVGCKSFQS